jgi:tetratricopeptide (TPR) repeat protein
VDGLLEIAYAYHGLSRTDAARTWLAKSLEAARAIEPPRTRAEALANAAAMLGKLQQEEAARATFDEAEQVAREIPDPISQAYALLHLGKKWGVAKLQGSADAARRLFDGAEAAADRITDSSLKNPLLETLRRARSGA